MDIPNLFGATDDAERLYSIMLARLQLHDAFQEIVAAADAIRAHARNSGDERAALLTHHHERDALWYLGRHDDNWARHVEFETQVFGGLIDLDAEDVADRDVYSMSQMRSPLHFACGRFSESAVCKERELSAWFKHDSFNDQLLYSVTNNDEHPTHPVRVTLRHVYAALGKSLTDWPGWEWFAALIPDPLVEKVGTTHEALRLDPSRLAAIGDAVFEKNTRNASRQPLPERTRSPWDDEVLKWFPFLGAYPR